MSRYARDSRDRVLEAVDMVALVSARTELRRAGPNSYFGRCPFHDERTGSFHVSPDEKLYHCFGCQASGDPFTFVMETEGLDFKGALEALAQRFGVALQTEREDPEAAARRRRQERLRELLERAAAYYERHLWRSAEADRAREHLLGRGLEQATLREFRVGYAPSAWDRVLRASRRAGFGDGELEAAGLARRSRSRPGAVYDYFRERIVFPVADARGRVCGFGARRMREDQPGGKYINTPEGELFHKREALFGIHLARAHAARAGRMVLVEGYTDVIALHQAGVRNCVGIMGTSFTEQQLGQLQRLVSVLDLCLDADAAGQEAIVRAAELAAGRGLALRVVELPQGLDPADILARDGPRAARALLERPVPFERFHVMRLLQSADTSSAEGRDAALAQLAPVLGRLPASVLRDELMRTVAGALELSEARLAALLRAAGGAGRAAPSAGTGRAAAGGARAAAAPGARLAATAGARLAATAGGGGAARAGASASPGPRAERMLLAVAVALGEPGIRRLSELSPDELLTSSVLRRAAAHLCEHPDAPLAGIERDDEPLARALAGIVRLAGRVPDPSPDRLEHARLVLERDRIDRLLVRARMSGAGSGELARRREELLAALHEVGLRLERAV
ncbi:MAG TPA: DNA primase [Solirubrobacteraceae bacterium]|nr:DNA primase [Solirubrobacteraceae bacterium]